uniref:Peptidase A1 domain-containing protein n=1 Tax=Kalanchoe fedtschenkoi TaxID=63787 RepID=A0A7N0UQM3_KALFE
MASSLLLFITLLHTSLLIRSSTSTTVTLPLAHFLPNPVPPSQLKLLNSLVSTSLARAKFLKSPQQPAINANTPLSAHSYGAYSTPLSFGTPPQTIPFVIQTATDFTWLPCTHKYICKDCNSPPPPPSFIPKASSSARFLPCLNPKCGWFHNTEASSRCQDCQPESPNCTQVCPPYIISSGSGYTGGVLLSETLDLTPLKPIPDFIIGCSVFSSKQPAGVLGLGRGPASFPTQLNLTRFSYCLLSHRFDDTSKTSNLVLDLGGPTTSSQKTPNLSYVQFTRNPPAFPTYYYLPLRKMTVGGRRVKIPYKFLNPGTDGSGGTIIDSGSAFSSMAGDVFAAVSTELVTQATYVRDAEMESRTGLTPCFNVSGIQTVSFPEMSLYFKGGAKMALPLANYFSFMGESSEAVCLTVVKDESGASGGPAVILGNYQMQNFYTEFDLRNGRFGYKPQIC